LRIIIFFKIKLKEYTTLHKDIFDAISKLQIVEINLNISNNLELVQTIFEKINHAGKELTAGDLVRNYLLLAHSTAEQNNLYKIWKQIELNVKNDYISKFAKDYLITKIYDDIPEKKIYDKFKGYILDNNTNADKETLTKNKEEILKNMLEFSPYYKWLLHSICPDTKINRIIKMLNLLKGGDFYPLLMLIIKKLYETNNQELIRILDLLADFLLRYRIVAPSLGGGSLRSALSTIIYKLSTNEIEYTYDAILFELSNSPTNANRFPDNADFEKALSENIELSYAKVLYWRIEQKETRNIPVDIDEITIEHLMPQKLSRWWKNNLGGDERASQIYENYLNNVGNLTPVSRSYNSEMSNNPWGEKLEVLKKVQFNITAEIPNKYPKWNEENIILRNSDITNRLVNIIIGPKERTRPLKSQNIATYETGKYSLTELKELDLAGAEFDSIIIGEDTIDCSDWNKLFGVICEKIIATDENKIIDLILNNNIHKSISTKNKSKTVKDPIITDNANLLVKPFRIKDSNYFYEGCLSAASAVSYTKQLCEYAGLIDKVYINIV